MLWSTHATISYYKSLLQVCWCFHFQYTFQEWKYFVISSFKLRGNIPDIMVIFSASAALESTVCPPMAQDASAPNAGVCKVSALSRNLCYLISTNCPYIRRGRAGSKKRRHVYDLGHTTPKIIKGRRFCLTLSGCCLSRDASLCLSVSPSFNTQQLCVCVLFECVYMCMCVYVCSLNYPARKAHAPY